MRTLLTILVAVVALIGLPGCVAQNPNPQSAYLVNSQGAVSPASRSALDGSTAPGRQELIGVYLPFVGTGLAVKAGLEWDGTARTIEIPVASAPQAAPQTVTEYVTEYVPETRMVPRTRAVQRVTVPVPQAVPRCPTPPPAPPQACAPGDPECAPPTVATASR